MVVFSFSFSKPALLKKAKMNRARSSSGESIATHCFCGEGRNGTNPKAQSMHSGGAKPRATSTQASNGNGSGNGDGHPAMAEQSKAKDGKHNCMRNPNPHVQPACGAQLNLGPTLTSKGPAFTAGEELQFPHADCFILDS